MNVGESIRVLGGDLAWMPNEGNITWTDGKEYGQWTKVFRRHDHGLTILAKFLAPKGKAWKLVAKAPELGEDVYILEGGYYRKSGILLAGPGAYMFNAPHASHGGITYNLLIFVHWCSGKKDYDKQMELIDFEYNS